jgi:sugar phosphate isomerase/epimerase
VRPTHLSAAVTLGPDGHAPAYFIRSPRETLSKLKELGYTGIDLLLRHPEDAENSGLDRILEQLNISLVSILTGPGKSVDGLSLADPQTSEAAVQRVISHLVYARRHSAKVVLGWLLGWLPEGAARAPAAALLAESLRRCAVEANRLQVPLLIEPLNRYETNVARTAAEALEWVQLVGGGLGLILDTFHMNIEEANLVAVAAQVATHVEHLHLADSNRLAPGAGHLPMEDFLAALTDAGYSGSVGIEALPVPDSETSATMAMAWLRQRMAVL